MSYCRIAHVDSVVPYSLQGGVHAVPNLLAAMYSRGLGTRHTMTSATNFRKVGEVGTSQFECMFLLVGNTIVAFFGFFWVVSTKLIHRIVENLERRAQCHVVEKN